MALIKSVRGFTPQIGKDTFLADNATIIGDVEIGEGCSIWFGTVLRGDVNSIRIGNGVNIQDGSVLHTLYEKSTIEIGDDVSVGHNVTRAHPDAGDIQTDSLRQTHPGLFRYRPLLHLRRGQRPGRFFLYKRRCDPSCIGKQ